MLPRKQTTPRSRRSSKACQTARQGLEDTLSGTDVQGEGTLQENYHLREDVQTAYFSAQGLNTPAVVNYINRINADFRAGIDRYNAFVRSQGPAVSNALKAAGMKALSIGRGSAVSDRTRDDRDGPPGSKT